MMDIRLIITDIDGVWTDGGMYYTESGDEFKKFTTSDSVGVLLARQAGIKLVIITGEKSKAVQKRAQKLKIEDCYIGIQNKLALAHKIASEENLTLEQIAFVGDEINDHPLLKAVGFSGCPQSAPSYTRDIVDYIVPNDGGKGVFRDFVIEVLKRMGSFDQYFRQVSVENKE